MDVERPNGDQLLTGDRGPTVAMWSHLRPVSNLFAPRLPLAVAGALRVLGVCAPHTAIWPSVQEVLPVATMGQCKTVGDVDNRLSQARQATFLTNVQQTEAITAAALITCSQQ